MAVIFQAIAGSVVKISAQRSNRGAPTIFSFHGGKPTQEGITTAVKYSQNVAAQFRTALQRTLYVFPFGDEPSNLEVAMNLFLFDCNGSPRESLTDVMAFYDKNKLSPDNVTPMTVSVGASTIQAFCIGMDIAAQQVQTSTVSTVRFRLLGWGKV